MRESAGLRGSDDELVSRFSGRADRRIGRFVGRPTDDRWAWDRELFALLGYPSADAPVSLDLLLRHVPDEERNLVADALHEATARCGGSAAVSCRLRTVDNRFRSVLLFAESMEVEPSRFMLGDLLGVDELESASEPWLDGRVVDLTDLRLTATREATAHAVAQATEHRAVIEQAKGMLMLIHRLDADAAFRLLCKRSQDTNTKLHEVAAAMVADLSARSLDSAT